MAESEKKKPLVFDLNLGKKSILNGIVFSEIIGRPKGLEKRTTYGQRKRPGS